MSNKRKSLPKKVSLTGSDDELSTKHDQNEFRTENDLNDNGVFEEDTITEINSDQEDLDNQSFMKLSQKDQSSAMLNNLIFNTDMKRKHKKFRPSDAEENNLDCFTELNGNNNNLASLVSSLASGQTPIDLLTLFTNSTNEQNNQINQVTKDLNKTNGPFRRKRSELELEDDDQKALNDVIKSNNLSANLLATMTNNQTTNKLSNEQSTPLQSAVDVQLSYLRKEETLPTNDTKQNSSSIIQLLKQIIQLKEKNLNQTEIQNGNSLVNGSASNTNLSMDIVSRDFLIRFLGLEYFRIQD